MTSDEIIDYALLFLGIVFVLIGIWFFKDFGIARYEITKGLCLEYKWDIITGTIFVLFGAGFALLIGNNDFKRFIRKKR